MFLKICIAIAILFSVLTPVESAPLKASRGNAAINSPVTNPDLETIRQRVIDDLLAPVLDDSLVTTLIQSIRADGSWPGINYDDVSRTGFEHSIHLQNMFQLARALTKAGSQFFQNEAVKDAALSSLDFWLKNDFICDNWWWNEMGTPSTMINTLLVLDTVLTDTQAREGLRIAGRANLEASGARPGGDLIQIAGMLGKQALFRRDDTIMERVVKVMADEIKIATGRGLQADMSFHHRVDKVICTLSYGLGYASSFSYWAVKISGTRYRFPENAIRLLTDYFLDGICKSMVHGRYPDPGAKNRDLSREGTLHPHGPELAENLLKISGYRSEELKKLIAIRKGEMSPNLSWNRFFWHSEYFTHQRPGYFTSVRMHSTRNHTMEQPHNEEGLKMHHVGDGANFISRTGLEYLDIFPVWDWQKIPGATIVQKPVHPHWRQIAKKGLSDFVGGVSDGQYGAAVFDFQSAHDPLKAKKAWFFFDDFYTCLGAGISSTSEYPVYTTLNQCLLKGEVSAQSKKHKTTLESGKHTLPNVSWVFHDGIGYIFPNTEAVAVSNTAQSGTWREINHQARASAQPVERDVFSLWLDHGVKPENAQYAYLVLPDVTSEELEQRARKTPIIIHENSTELQAVTEVESDRTQVVFYQAGKIKLSQRLTLYAESPCMLMVKLNGENIERLSVSDPSRKLSRLQIKISSVIEGSGPEWRSTWDKHEKKSVIDIELPKENYAGQTVVIALPAPRKE